MNKSSLRQPILRPSVSVILHAGRVVEFFLSSTRRHELIKASSDEAIRVILSLDGSRTIAEMCEGLTAAEERDLRALLVFLEAKSIVTDVTAVPSHHFRHRRITNFLGDYAQAPQDLEVFWRRMQNAVVVIIGVGAVGSWVAYQLAQTGVGKLVLCDDDKVEPSNLNRQIFSQDDIGLLKVEALGRRLRTLDHSIEILGHPIRLDESTDLKHMLPGTTLVINCADYPNVDQTSEWIGRACMAPRIPHLIAGGYNLHLSLVGNTILPFESACVRCLQMGLSQLAPPLPHGLKRLVRPIRKLGSLAPLAALSASFTVMETIKVLTRCTPPGNVNRRGEFDVRSRTIKYLDLPRQPDCEWCGSKS